MRVFIFVRFEMAMSARELMRVAILCESIEKKCGSLNKDKNRREYEYAKIHRRKGNLMEDFLNQQIQTTERKLRYGQILFELWQLIVFINRFQIKKEVRGGGDDDDGIMMNCDEAERGEHIPQERENV